MARRVSDQRYREQRLRLGRTVLSRQRVYLDTCFWVRLRDHVSGTRQEDRLATLLNLLVDGVEADRIICPIEGSHLIELFKQTDPATRQETARLMDRLSRGICLAPPEERRRIEILYFLRKHDGTATTALHEPRELVWTRITDVFGACVPDNPRWSEEVRATIQTGFQDHLWTIGVEDVLDVPGWEVPVPLPDLNELVTTLNEGKVTHQAEGRSVEQLQRAELRGGLDAVLDVLQDASEYLYTPETGRRPTNAEHSDMTGMPELSAIIVAGYRKGSLGRDLPSLTVPARLHAAMRWDRRREYSENDMLDLWHASAALPYCNKFLADGALANTITAGHVGLDRLFGCRVAGSVEEALDVLKAYPLSR